MIRVLKPHASGAFLLESATLKIKNRGGPSAAEWRYWNKKAGALKPKHTDALAHLDYVVGNQDAMAHLVDLTEEEHNQLMGLDGEAADDYSEESSP